MTLYEASPQVRISWRVVGAIPVALVVAAVGVATLWPQPKPLPVPPPIVEPPTPFQPSPAFEAANDLPVLRAVLEKPCKADTPLVLSSQPDGHLGNRSSHKPGTFPQGLDCPGLRIVDANELDTIFSMPYQGKRDFKHQGGWGNFYDAYPEASGLLKLSLPSYPTPTSAVVQIGTRCAPLCGSGWEIALEKVGGKWVVRERRPSWIA